MKTLLTLIFSLSSLILFSQDSISTTMIKNSQNVISFLSPKLKTNSYLLYYINGSYLIVNKQKNDYKLFFVDEIKEQQKYMLYKEESIKNNSILDNTFEGNACDEKFLKSNIEGSSYTYFSLIINNKKDCEYFLPIITYTKNEIKYPISDNLNTYLLNKFLEITNSKSTSIQEEKKVNKLLVNGEYENVIKNSIDLLFKEVKDKEYLEKFIIVNDAFKIYENKLSTLNIPGNLKEVDKSSLKKILKLNKDVYILKISTVHINSIYNIAFTPYKVVFHRKENEIVFLPSQSDAVFYYEYHKNEISSEEWKLKNYITRSALLN